MSSHSTEPRTDKIPPPPVGSKTGEQDIGDHRNPDVLTTSRGRRKGPVSRGVVRRGKKSDIWTTDEHRLVGVVTSDTHRGEVVVVTRTRLSITGGGGQ